MINPEEEFKFLQKEQILSFVTHSEKGEYVPTANIIAIIPLKILKEYKKYSEKYYIIPGLSSDFKLLLPDDLALRKSR